MTGRAVFGMSALIGTAYAYLVISTMNKNVASLMNCDLTSRFEGGLLCGMNGGDALVPFTLYSPLVVASGDDVLIFAHGEPLVMSENTLNYNNSSCHKKSDTGYKGRRYD